MMAEIQRPLPIYKWGGVVTYYLQFKNLFDKNGVIGKGFGIAS
jgi:hypothetical protein